MTHPMGARWAATLAAGLAFAVVAGAEERQHLVVVHHDAGNVAIVDPGSGGTQAIVRVGLGPRAVALSPDGRTAVVSNYGLGQGGSTLSVVDVAAARLTRTVTLSLDRREPGEERHTVTYHRPGGVCFLPNGRQVLVTCESERALLLVDVIDAKVVAAIDVGQELPRAVALSRDGRRAFVANEGSGSVAVVDMNRRRVERVVEAGGGARSLALHPLRDELWVANGSTSSISVLDTQTLEERTEFPCATDPMCVAFTPDGASVLCVNRHGGSVSVFSTAHHKAIREIELERLDRELAAERPLSEPLRNAGLSPLPRGVLVHPSLPRAWVTCARSDRIAEIDTGTWQVLRYLEAGRGPDGLVWSSYEDDRASAK